MCKDCGGSGICEHGRRRSRCKECSGSGICEHGRRRNVCKECEECGTVSHVIVPEATEVDVESDGEEGSHQEEFPTVPAHIFSFLSGREAVSTSAESLRQQFEG